MANAMHKFQDMVTRIAALDNKFEELVQLDKEAAIIEAKHKQTDKLDQLMKNIKDSGTRLEKHLEENDIHIKNAHKRITQIMEKIADIGNGKIQEANSEDEAEEIETEAKEKKAMQLKAIVKINDDEKILKTFLQYVITNIDEKMNKKKAIIQVNMAKIEEEQEDIKMRIQIKMVETEEEREKEKMRKQDMLIELEERNEERKIQIHNLIASLEDDYEENKMDIQRMMAMVHEGNKNAKMYLHIKMAELEEKIEEKRMQLQIMMVEVEENAEQIQMQRQIMMIQAESDMEERKIRLQSMILEAEEAIEEKKLPLQIKMMKLEEKTERRKKQIQDVVKEVEKKARDIRIRLKKNIVQDKVEDKKTIELQKARNKDKGNEMMQLKNRLTELENGLKSARDQVKASKKAALFKTLASNIQSANACHTCFCSNASNQLHPKEAKTNCDSNQHLLNYMERRNKTVQHDRHSNLNELKEHMTYMKKLLQKLNVDISTSNSYNSQYREYVRNFLDNIDAETKGPFIGQFTTMESTKSLLKAKLI
ncbi:hypothetical protein BDF19DRAFT_462795 [Syncephalis fuscata]|nr:hypothetical protein BDF19DRAFT_462795 [Syncephalis fuscata]